VRAVGCCVGACAGLVPDARGCACRGNGSTAFGSRCLDGLAAPDGVPDPEVQRLVRVILGQLDSSVKYPIDRITAAGVHDADLQAERPDIIRDIKDAIAPFLRDDPTVAEIKAMVCVVYILMMIPRPRDATIKQHVIRFAAEAIGEIVFEAVVVWMTPPVALQFFSVVHSYYKQPANGRDWCPADPNGDASPHSGAWIIPADCTATRPYDELCLVCITFAEVGENAQAILIAPFMEPCAGTGEQSHMPLELVYDTNEEMLQDAGVITDENARYAKHLPVEAGLGQFATAATVYCGCDDVAFLCGKVFGFRPNGVIPSDEGLRAYDIFMTADSNAPRDVMAAFKRGEVDSGERVAQSAAAMVEHSEEKTEVAARLQAVTVATKALRELIEPLAQEYDVPISSQKSDTAGLRKAARGIQGQQDVEQRKLEDEHGRLELEQAETSDMRTWLDRTHSDVSAVDQQMNSAKKERAATELSQRGVDVTDPRILELMRAAVAANRS